VRSDLKGSGLGTLLMDKLIRTLRAQGTRRLVATVLGENYRMRTLAKRLGFAESRPDNGDSTRDFQLLLYPESTPQQPAGG